MIVKCPGQDSLPSGTYEFEAIFIIPNTAGGEDEASIESYLAGLGINQLVGVEMDNYYKCSTNSNCVGMAACTQQSTFSIANFTVTEASLEEECEEGSSYVSVYAGENIVWMNCTSQSQCLDAYRITVQAKLAAGGTANCLCPQ